MSAPEEFQLPLAATAKLAEHPNGNLLEALDHPLRRVIIREIQFADQPRCVMDLEQTGESPVLRVVNRRDLEYHVGVLADLGALAPIGAERVTAYGNEPIYLSTVAGDRVVKEVLVETADLDLRFGGGADQVEGG